MLFFEVAKKNLSPQIVIIVKFAVVDSNLTFFLIFNFTTVSKH